jgi:L-malate glycosyltransferase
MLRVLHITAWYPNDNDPGEGAFIRDRIEALERCCANDVIHLHVKRTPVLLRWRHQKSDGFEQFILESRFLPWRVIEWICSRMIIRLWKKYSYRNYDLVNFHIAYPMLVNLRQIRQAISIPIVVSEHWSAYHFNFYLEKDNAGLRRMKRVFDPSIGLITVSDALASDIRSWSGLRSIRAVTVPNGINARIFKPDGDSHEDGHFLAVNRWTPIKNPMGLLEAWKRVTLLHPQLCLRIAGEGSSVPDMKKYVSEHELAEQVEFLGALSQEQVAVELRKSRALVFSSQYETFYRPAAESLMCGTPLIGPPLAAIREYTSPDDGVFATDHSPEALAEAILRFIERERHQRTDRFSIARRAMERFEQGASAKLYFRALLELSGITE